MFAPITTSFMIASLLVAQSPVPSPQAAPAATSAPAAQTITVPVGTAVPLTLMTPIQSKSTKPGDTVRAVVAFPVTVGSQLAIPAGTYAQGAVIAVNAKPASGQQPTVKIHFTQLIFSNGYSVALDGQNTQSYLVPDAGTTQPLELAELTPFHLPGAHFAMGEGQEPPTQPPTLPRIGPSPGELAGISIGATVGILVGTLLYAHHRANNYNFVVFDSGWQFQMVLASPVELDAAQVAAAASAPSAS